MHILDTAVLIHVTDHQPRGNQTISQSYADVKAAKKAQKAAAKQANVTETAARSESVASDWTDMTDLKEGEASTKKSWLAKLKDMKEKR